MKIAYTQDEMISAFKSEDEKILRQCYPEWKEPFRAFIQKKFGIDGSSTEEIFNDSNKTMDYPSLNNGSFSAIC